MSKPNLSQEVGVEKGPNRRHKKAPRRTHRTFGVEGLLRSKLGDEGFEELRRELYRAAGRRRRRRGPKRSRLAR